MVCDYFLCLFAASSIVEHGVIDVEPLSVILDTSRDGLENDFMKMHPKKNIAQLGRVGGC